jgi:radical SAM PhpK family P-methyltransferase
LNSNIFDLECSAVALPTPSRLTCVIVGNNTGDFERYIADRKAMAKWAGAYRDAQINSILWGDRRISYMDLFNELRRRRDPSAEKLSPFDPLGLAGLHLTSFLARQGISAALVGEFQKGRSQLAALLADEPLAVAITTTFYFEPTPMVEIVRFVRERSPRTKVIIGGPYPSQLERGAPGLLQPTLAEIGADVYVVDSQGELTLSRVVRALERGEDLSGIPNLIYFEEGRMLRTGRQVEDNPIDDNRVDWTLFDRELLEPFSMMRTAISCPFACSFCSYPVRAGEHRLARVETIEAELRTLDSLGVRHVYFIDDTFNVPVPRFKELCRMMIRNRFRFQWISYLRCGNMDEEAVKLAAESGCVGALLGIESGDADVLQLMNKFARPDRYRRAIRWLEDAGIMTWALFFVGFPGDGEQAVRNTMSLIEDTAPSFFATQMWFYDPTTPIHQRAAELGLQGNGYRWKHRTMGWQEACDWVESMLREVKSSIYVPQTGFSFENIFYLRGKGVALEPIKQFLRLGQRLVVEGLGDRPGAGGDLVAQLEGLSLG